MDRPSQAESPTRRGGPDAGPKNEKDRAGLRGPLIGDHAPDQAFTLSFSALAMVILTTLSAGLVIISCVCGLRT